MNDHLDLQERAREMRSQPTPLHPDYCLPASSAFLSCGKSLSELVNAVMLPAETVCPFAFGLLKLGGCAKKRKKKRAM